MGFRAFHILFSTLAVLFWTGTAWTQELDRTPRLPVLYEIDSSVPQDAPLDWEHFTAEGPSAEALASQLAIDDLAYFSSSSSANAALLSGSSMAQQGRLTLSLAMMTVAVESYPDNIQLRADRMNTALIAGRPQIAMTDALFVIRKSKALQAQYDVDLAVYQDELAAWEARQPQEGDDDDAAEDSSDEAPGNGESAEIVDDPRPIEPRPPFVEPLAEVVALTILARNEDWDSIERLNFSDLGQPIFNFVAQGIWTFATLDQDDQSQALIRVDQTFGVGGFDTQKQFLLGLALISLGDPENAITGLNYALQNSELGSQRAAIWAYRAAELSGQEDAVRAYLSNLRSNAQRSYQLFDLLSIELEANQSAPTKREMTVELLMQLVWFFTTRENQQLAQTMADLAWMIDGGDQRGSAQVTLMRVGLNSEDNQTAFAQFHINEFDSVPEANVLQLSESVSALLRRDDYQSALDLVDAELSKQDEDDIELTTRLLPLKANALLVAERYDEAIEVYQQWQQALAGANLIRADWVTFFQWATAHFWNGELDKMEAHINQARELNPNNPFATNFLAYSWIDKGIRLEEGLEMLLEADAISPDRASIVDSIGWAYYRLGDFETAVEFLERAWNLESSSWEIADHLGDVYQALGRPDEARWFWQRSLGLEDIPQDRLEQLQAKLGIDDQSTL